MADLLANTHGSGRLLARGLSATLFSIVLYLAAGNGTGPQPGFERWLRSGWLGPLRDVTHWGDCAIPGSGCDELLRELELSYGVFASGDWRAAELRVVRDELGWIAARLGGSDLEAGRAKFRAAIGGFSIRKEPEWEHAAGYDMYTGYTYALGWRARTIHVYRRCLQLLPDHALVFRRLLAHEVGHAWDYNGTDARPGGRLSGPMAVAVGSYYRCEGSLCVVGLGARRYDPGPEGPVECCGATGGHALDNEEEDWAESFAAWMHDVPLTPLRAEYVARRVSE